MSFDKADRDMLIATHTIVEGQEKRLDKLEERVSGIHKLYGSIMAIGGAIMAFFKVKSGG